VISYLSQHAPGEWPAHAADTDDVYGEWVRAENSSANMVILYLHGGAYVVGSAQLSRFMSNKLSTVTQCHVFAINYRLAPQNPYPCALIDAVSAYLYLLTRFSPQQIVIAGESAGGGLTLATLLVLRDMGLDMPLGGYCMSPWVDLKHSSPTFESNAPYDYLPGSVPDSRLGDRVHYYTEDQFCDLPYVSPLYAKDLKGLPPLLIQTGSAERLYGEDLLFARKEGTSIRFEEYRAHVHVFHIFPFGQGSKQALERFKTWLWQISGRAPGHKSYSEHIVLDFHGSPIDYHFL
jgi:acetyl esterase/lipase